MSIRKELNKRRQARRAARATEQGVAGHQAAMAALSKATGWEKKVASRGSDVPAGFKGITENRPGVPYTYKGTHGSQKADIKMNFYSFGVSDKLEPKAQESRKKGIPNKLEMVEPGVGHVKER